ncbi:hypothetical protein HYH02_002081 [Chlamydomonas schloesseri]|uniref:Uncharacterized protein n=1 Tax=Chlamydomonas schloesseri TaxID=2026947 RepID=A0A836BCJ9_9CHLO|nr:hypothetical protein HYH02_002081 [Chlamydomonas schloesseri]|eukprot:KAG2453875.1 hypothetical protein HYH02_002081 [Chlamydomonas schloesseri]
MRLPERTSVGGGGHTLPSTRHRRQERRTSIVDGVVSPHHRNLVAYFLSTEVAKDIAGIVVVTGALLVYGLLQERIVTIGFGAEKEVFSHSIFLVLCNRLVTVAMALLYLVCSRTTTAPAAPLKSYASVSLTNVIATACQYEALQYVSFAVQTLAKSAKALPVMLWSTLYMRKRFKVSEYLHAFCITLGCSVFILTGHVRSRVADKALARAAVVVEGTGMGVEGDAALVLIGGGLMVLYLFVDGLTSTWQDSMFRGYPVSVADQVLYTTSFSMGLSFIGCVATHQLLPPLAFLARNPEAIAWILALSVASALVQLVISWTIKRYGAVVFATIMTTRQFFSILLSSVVFLTPLTLGQWAGTLLVFGAIYAKAAQKFSEHRQHVQATEAKHHEDDRDMVETPTKPAVAEQHKSAPLASGHTPVHKSPLNRDSHGHLHTSSSLELKTPLLERHPREAMGRAASGGGMSADAHPHSHKDGEERV